MAKNAELELLKQDHKASVAAASRRFKTKTMEALWWRKGAGLTTAATIGTMNRFGVPVSIGGLFPCKPAVTIVAPPGGLLDPQVGTEAPLAQCEKQPPVDRLQPVAHIGQRARHDGRQGVGQIALAQRIGERLVENLGGEGFIGHGRSVRVNTTDIVVTRP